MSLRLLTYNVHGAPPVPGLFSRPGTRMPLIRQKLDAYDLVLLQEDFAYHDELSAGVPQQRRARGGDWTWRWGYVPTAPLWFLCWLTTQCGNPPFQGAGLSTLAMPATPELPRPIVGFVKLVADTYTHCSDYLIGGNDCFAAKGYLGVRITLTNGAEVDVYNTHLESGFWPMDQNVRRRQMEELAFGIQEKSGGRAVILAGDLNSKLTGGWTKDDFRPLRMLMLALDLNDSEVPHEPKPCWEDLDYVLYRSGTGAVLTVDSAGIDPSFSYRARDRESPPPSQHDPECCRGEEKPLSDHPATYAIFQVRPAD